MSSLKRKIQRKLKDQSVKELILGSGISFAVKLSGVLFAFLFNWIITKYYGVTDLGIVTSAISLLSLFTILTKFGVDSAFLRFVSIYKKTNSQNVKELEKKSYIIQFSTSIIVSVLVYIFAEFIAVSMFHKANLTEPIKMISFGFLPYSLFSLHSEGLRALKDVKSYSFIQMTGRFMFGFMIFAVFCYGLKIMLDPTLVFVISLYLTLIYSFIFWEIKKRKMKAKIEESLALNEEETSYKSIFKLSFPLMLASSSAFLMNWTDLLMLTYYGSEADVAIYNVAIRYAMVSKIILTSVNAVTAANFAEYYHDKNFKELKKVVQNSTKLIFWISLPILLITIIFPNFLMGIYGPEYVAGTWVLVIFSLAQFISAISGSVGYLLQMTGYQKQYQNIILTTTFLSVALNFALIPLWGINGAALSGFITIVARNLYSVWFIKKKFGFMTLYLPIKFLFKK